MKAINANAPVKCTMSTTINAPVEKVWELLTGVDEWSNWQSEITAAKLNGKLTPETTFDWKSGGMKIHSKLHIVELHRFFGWSGKAFGMLAIHNWELSESDGATTVVVSESMEGLMAKLMRGYMNRILANGMQFWLEQLKITSEK